MKRLHALFSLLFVWVRTSKFVRLASSAMLLLLLLVGVGFGLMRVIGAQNPVSPFVLPYVEEFQDVNVKNWFSKGGAWSIRNESLAQIANLDEPAHLFIPQTFDAEQLYHLSLYVTVGRTTQQVGLDFNAQYDALLGKTQRLYLARPAESQQEAPPAKNQQRLDLTSGYTDDQGTFIPQVSVPFTVPLTGNSQQYRLDLYVLGNTYSVQVNGQTLIEQRPLFYPSGFIGFYALGPALFDTVKVTAADVVLPGEQVYVSDFDQLPGGAGWVPFAGDWEIDQNEMVQANPVAQDAGLAYEGAAFENYMLQASFHHLTGVGGGLLFNMLSPYQLNGAYLVRYSEQSDALYWGYFDEKGIFVRQGFQTVAPPGEQTHQLRVDSEETTYSLFLDGQKVAEKVPMQRPSGHIGLISTRSSVAYSLVEVFPLLNGIPAVRIKENGARASQLVTSEEGISETLESGRAIPITPESTATLSVPKSTSTPPLPSATPTASATASATLMVSRNITKAAPLATDLPTKRPALLATPVVTTTQNVSKTFGITTPTRAIAKATATPLATDSPRLAKGGYAPLRSDFKDTSNQYDWQAINGDWLKESGRLTQQDAKGFDRSIVYVANAFQEYQLEVTLSHQQGSGGGILFNMPYPSQLAGAYMVRFSDRRAGGIFWGHFDQTGKFLGEGYATVTPPDDQPRILRIVSTATTYSLYLDHQALAENVPFDANANYGYVGLITSQSVVRFSNITLGRIGSSIITPATATPLPSNATRGLQSLRDQKIVSGQWQIKDGSYTQTAPDAADYILNTGIYAANYQAEVEVVLADKPDSSGGLILHMPDRNQKQGAFMVRLVRGGTAVMWGAFDETGAFRGRGSAPLPNKPEEGVYQMKLTVQSDRLMIQINEQLIAEDVLLPSGEGWIGLLAFGGPTTFRNVKIMVGL